MTEQWKMIFGPLLILVVLFARGGLAGLVACSRGDAVTEPVLRLETTCARISAACASPTT